MVVVSYNNQEDRKLLIKRCSSLYERVKEHLKNAETNPCCFGELTSLLELSMVYSTEECYSSKGMQILSLRPAFPERETDSNDQKLPMLLAEDEELLFEIIRDFESKNYGPIYGSKDSSEIIDSLTERLYEAFLGLLNVITFEEGFPSILRLRSQIFELIYGQIKADRE